MMRPGALAADRANRLDAAHRAELQVHQRHVGPVLPVQRHRFLAGRGERDDLHVGLTVDDQRDALADDPVIVDAEHADPTRGHLPAPHDDLGRAPTAARPS